MKRIALSQRKPSYPEISSTLVISAAVLLMATAVIFRMINFLGERSLWLDEVMVALNIIELPFRGLATALYFDEMAPVGWLLVQRLIYVLWSNFDYSLRILSLLAGIVALPVFWSLARRVLDRAESIAALFLFGLSSAAIEYSAMAKPYMLDALFSSAILLVGVSVAKDGWTSSRLTALWSLGIASILFSFGGCFVSLSTGVTLFLKTSLERQRWSMPVAIMGLTWALLFALTYEASYSHQAATIGRMMNLYWVDAFAPWPTTVSGIRWYAGTSASLTGFMFARSVRWIALVLIIVGAIGLRARRWEIALLLAPVAISLCAGLAHLFPVHGRLQLWLFPPFAILASSGIGTLAQLITLRATRFRYAVIAAISAPLAFGVAQATVRSVLKAPPWAFEEVEPNLRLLAHHRAQDDTTIVTLDAEKALLLYSDKAGLRGLRYRRLAGRRDQPWCALRNLRNLPAHGRIWLLTYHDVPVNEPGEKVLLAGLARRGRIQIIGSEPGSRLYRVDLARKVADAPIPPECFRPADFIGFRGLLAARHELVPMDPEGNGPA